MQAKKTKQGNEWARFVLIGEKTAVDVELWPAVYAQFRDLVGPVKIPDEHPFTNLRPPRLTLTGRVRPAGWPGHRPTVNVTSVVCADHASHDPHPPLPPIASARIAVSSLMSAARGLRDAIDVDRATPVAEIVNGVRDTLAELESVFAEYKGNPLYGRDAGGDAEAHDLAVLLQSLIADTGLSLRDEASS